MGQHEKRLAYKTPPKRVFRSLGLGSETDGRIKVIAGFRPPKWWDIIPAPEPIFVMARIIRRHS